MVLEYISGFCCGQTVRIYADPGSRLTMSIDGVPAGAGLGFNLNLSGHTVQVE